MQSSGLKGKTAIITGSTSGIGLGMAEALAAEGVGGSRGYSPLNKEPFLKDTIQSKAYRRIYPEKLLKDWQERTTCPDNDRLCEQAVWFTQNMLLGPRSDMEEIAAAIRKLQARASDLRSLA